MNSTSSTLMTAANNPGFNWDASPRQALTPFYCAFSPLALAAFSAAFLTSPDLFRYASKPMPPNTSATPIHCFWLRLWP